MNTPVTVGDIGEHGLIQEIINVAPSARNGDDAAVLLPASPNSRTVVTTDMLIENQHFTLENSTAFEIGVKAITANFADIEAMGARPIAALMALAIPADYPVEMVRGLAEGVHSEADKYAAELVGGDVTRGRHLIVTITAVGQLGGSIPPLTLDRAKPGQTVVAHGEIGHSAAGLALLQHFGRENVPERFSPLITAHCAPTLVPNRGVIARSTGATTMTDNSDGLVVDLGNIAKHSGVGIDVKSSTIAPSDLLIEAGKLLNADPWEWILSGGEDHTLLATTPADVPSGFRAIGTVTKTGRITVDGETPAFGTGWVSF